jgi:hypothetical protein
MINGDRPTLGPNAGRKARKVGSARSVLLPMRKGLPAAPEGRKIEPPQTASGESRLTAAFRATMATTRRMLQLYVEQVSDELVTEVQSLSEEVFIFLNPAKKTVIREISVEEFGGIIAIEAPGIVPIGWTDRAVARVRLFFAAGQETEHFYAPSHVESPELEGVIGAGLSVLELGVNASGPQLALARGIGAHAYIDERDEPTPRDARD